MSDNPLVNIGVGVLCIGFVVAWATGAKTPAEAVDKIGGGFNYVGQGVSDNIAAQYYGGLLAPKGEQCERLSDMAEKSAKDEDRWLWYRHCLGADQTKIAELDAERAVANSNCLRWEPTTNELVPQDPSLCGAPTHRWDPETGAVEPIGN